MVSMSQTMTLVLMSITLLQEAMSPRVGDHTPHFAFRNTAIERRGPFESPSGSQNVIHHLIAHALEKSSPGALAIMQYLIGRRRKWRPIHQLDRHQARNAQDGRRADDERTEAGQQRAPLVLSGRGTPRTSILMCRSAWPGVLTECHCVSKPAGSRAIQRRPEASPPLRSATWPISSPYRD